jgi:monovalent cation/proton antiporter MnhG/PhaG subunit
MSSVPLGSAVLLVVGTVLVLAGCLALVRLSDVYARLGAAGKCTTLGVALLLLGGALAMGGAVAAKAGLCVVLVLISGMAAVHAVARGAHRSGEVLPPGADDYREDMGQRNDR